VPSGPGDFSPQRRLTTKGHMFYYCSQAVPMRQRAGLGSASTRRPAGHRSSKLRRRIGYPAPCRPPERAQAPALSEVERGPLVARNPFPISPRRRLHAPGVLDLGAACPCQPLISIWGNADHPVPMEPVILPFATLSSSQHTHVASAPYRRNPACRASDKDPPQKHETPGALHRASALFDRCRGLPAWPRS
jgi:hypothetical protein